MRSHSRPVCCECGNAYDEVYVRRSPGYQAQQNVFFEGEILFGGWLLYTSDANFLSKSILEGIVYEKTTPQGIVYAASVCYPQTDLYMPLSITTVSYTHLDVYKRQQ